MQMLKWFVGALALLAVACGEVSETSTPVIRDGEGLLELPLVSTSAGRSYKLVGATFAITGPQNATITDTSAESVSLPLMAGTYTIQMNGEWHVERTDAPGVTVPVTLVSPNPMSFTLGEGETRPVRFLFKVPEDGTANVGIGVDTGGWISGTIDFEPRYQPVPSDPQDVFAELGEKSISFVISFESATVTRSAEYGRKQAQVQTSPVTVQLGGPVPAAVLQRFVAPLQGRTMNFLMESYPSYAELIGSIRLENMEQNVRFELDPQNLVLGVDAEGYPLLQSVPFTGLAIFSAGPSPTIYGAVDDGTFAPR
ncbi:putative lipoprotein [Corallococcus coralloides DSM 2259]|uniref:Putative lipoprotein n=1 Tax=Corallococcus coralloides (strain ATCC 25202 / DSM 2259 / NBRC 100086 / M2) TaxID=1144275 RepID=H8MZA0_CORCM|nr:hypothetical protein [Corallococcus coralloides]AFE07097.1 putative lipoprotein [Corallococcus coralloides DSM 2259]